MFEMNFSLLTQEIRDNFAFNPLLPCLLGGAHMRKESSIVLS